MKDRVNVMYIYPSKRAKIIKNVKYRAITPKRNTLTVEGNEHIFSTEDIVYVPMGFLFFKTPKPFLVIYAGYLEAVSVDTIKSKTFGLRVPTPEELSQLIDRLVESLLKLREQTNKLMLVLVAGGIGGIIGFMLGKLVGG